MESDTMSMTSGLTGGMTEFESASQYPFAVTVDGEEGATVAPPGDGASAAPSAAASAIPSRPIDARSRAVSVAGSVDTRRTKRELKKKAKLEKKLRLDDVPYKPPVVKFDVPPSMAGAVFTISEIKKLREGGFAVDYIDENKEVEDARLAGIKSRRRGTSSVGRGTSVGGSTAAGPAGEPIGWAAALAAAKMRARLFSPDPTIFSFPERAQIVDLARKYESGVDIEPELWPKLREALRGDPANIGKMARAVRRVYGAAAQLGAAKAAKRLDVDDAERAKVPEPMSEREWELSVMTPRTRKKALAREAKARRAAEKAAAKLLRRPDEDAEGVEESAPKTDTATPAEPAAAKAADDLDQVRFDPEKINFDSHNLFQELFAGHHTLEQVLFRLMNEPVVDEHAVRLVISRKVDVNTVGPHGWQPLHLAAIRGFRGLAEDLVLNGADVNAKDDAGYLPLHYACLYNRWDVALMLRQCATDITTRSRTGLTPIDVAFAAGHEKLGERLKRALNLTEEAMLRAKKFVVKLMQGDVSYWGPEDQRPEEYFVGRLMLAIVVLEPKYLTGIRVKRQLIPEDLDDIPRLARKAFGEKKWGAVVESDLHLDPKVFPIIAKRVFNGQLTAEQVGDKLRAGRESYYKGLRDKKEDARVAAYEADFAEFVKWARDPEPRHRAKMLKLVRARFSSLTPVAQVHLEDFIELNDPCTVYIYEKWHPEERMIVDELREVFHENNKELLSAGDDEENAKLDALAGTTKSIAGLGAATSTHIGASTHVGSTSGGVAGGAGDGAGSATARSSGMASLAVSSVVSDA